jgi:hypothetical protein
MGKVWSLLLGRNIGTKLEIIWGNYTKRASLDFGEGFVYELLEFLSG